MVQDITNSLMSTIEACDSIIKKLDALISALWGSFHILTAQEAAMFTGQLELVRELYHMAKGQYNYLVVRENALLNDILPRQRRAPADARSCHPPFRLL